MIRVYNDKNYPIPVVSFKHVGKYDSAKEIHRIVAGCVVLYIEFKEFDAQNALDVLREYRDITKGEFMEVRISIYIRTATSTEYWLRCFVRQAMKICKSMSKRVLISTTNHGPMVFKKKDDVHCQVEWLFMDNDFGAIYVYTLADVSRVAKYFNTVIMKSTSGGNDTITRMRMWFRKFGPAFANVKTLNLNAESSPIANEAFHAFRASPMDSVIYMGDAQRELIEIPDPWLKTLTSVCLNEASNCGMPKNIRDCSALKTLLICGSYASDKISLPDGLPETTEIYLSYGGKIAFPEAWGSREFARLTGRTYYHLNLDQRHKRRRERAENSETESSGDD